MYAPGISSSPGYKLAQQGCDSVFLSTDVSPLTVPAPLEPPENPEDMEGQELEMRPQDEEKEEKEEEAAMASPWSGPGNQVN